MNIYVSHLSYSVTSEDLQKAFEEYGEVSSVKVITDKFTGRSRGFGFVEMNDEDGQKAIDGLNGTSIDNREISVAVSQPRENTGRDRNYRSNNRFNGNQRDNNNRY
ncbi:MAG: RNA-binding protein [Bacteroidales bacterium]|jgi:RNA recognition motif-containing protein|nr:RNA-binding protein [Bacteroidales bacterium]